MFRNELVPVDRLCGEHPAHAGGVKRLGGKPVVIEFASGTAKIEVAARAGHRAQVTGPAVEAIRSGVRISPYQPGAQGTAVATYLVGGAAQPAPETRFTEGSGRSFNTIPPNDSSYWDAINILVQQEPPGAGDPETMGLLASLGIVHGTPFKPDERMRAVLQDAVTVGIATARTVSFAPRPEEGWAYYPGSAWFNMLFTGGYEFLDPPPQLTADGAVASPSDGARKLNARTAFFYPYTGITPAMCMRLPGIGSQYLIAMRDGSGEFLDGGHSYRLTLPPGIPESRFWPVLLYDNQTRSMLQTDQPRPDLGSQSGTVTTNPDGSTDIYFGPTAPDGKETNWLQTIPGKGWFTVIRFYNPLPSFFDKTWRPSEIEPA